MFTFCKCRALRDTLNQTSKAVSSLARRTIGIDVKLTMLAMRITAAILLICSLHVTAKSVSQTITLSGKNIPLTKVFSEIEKQSGYLVVYNEDLISAAKPITVEVKDYPLLDFMEETFSRQGLGYVIENKTIFLKRKEKEKVTEREDPPVTGIVRGPDGQPLAGVNVMIKGTTKGTTTDKDGRFSIEVDEGQVLEISSIGFGKKHVTIAASKVIAIDMEVSASPLDEVQYIAYGTQSKRFSVGNISTVKAADIEKQPVQNPLLALQGRVTGMEITQLTGLNGGGVKVQIQGRNSINSGLEPLIVIDGVPYPSQLFSNGLELLVQGGSPLNYINPSDVESMDILKDADATAIYGSRAANGAILITTKKGKAGKTKLSISLQQGWTKVTRFADVLNTREYLDMRYEAYKNDGIDLTAQTIGSNNYDLKLWDTTRNTDWQKELIGGTANYTNISTSISGGNATMQYLIGSTYARQSTVFPGNFDDKKGGLHFNINSASVNQRLTVQLTGSYLYDQNHLPGIDLTRTAVLLEPVAPALYNDNGTLNWATNVAGNSTFLNPLAYTENSDFKNTTRSLTTNLIINYTVLPGLSIGSSLGYTDLQSNNYLPTRLEYYRPERRATTERDARYGTRQMSNWIIEPQIKYTERLRKANLEVLLGYSLQKSSASSIEASGSGFSNDQLMGSVSAAPIKNVDGTSVLYKYSASFGRLNINWDKKYIVNVSLRRDGSSRFGDKSKFHNFWSAGLGWIFSQERWMEQNLHFLSFAKLRTSYGTTGNDQIGDYGYISTYFPHNTGIAYQGTSGLQVISVSNPYLQWEETRKWQSGIDLGFLKDRLLAGVTYAENKSSNQLISYVLPDVTGFSFIAKNFPATIRNTSWEFTLHAEISKRKYFTWTGEINLTIPRNKIVKFPGVEKTSYASGNFGVIVGQPLGVVKAFRFAGVDPATGMYMCYDEGGKTVLFPEEKDRTALISGLTKYYGGWQQTLTFKSWQLSVLIQYVKQTRANEFYYGNPSVYPGAYVATGASNQPRSVYNRWRNPGDEVAISKFGTNRIAPRIPLYSDKLYTDDASFIRLKNIALSWQLPDFLMRKIAMQSGNIFFRGENLATVTRYVGIDPENQNINSLPPLQVWTIGVKAEL